MIARRLLSSALRAVAPSPFAAAPGVAQLGVRTNMYFTATHEWLRLDESGVGTIGITDDAQEQLGDVVYVELPSVGESVRALEPFASLESVKAAAEVRSPVTGTVVDVNSTLEGSPDTINADAENAGWIAKVQLADAAELEALQR